MAYVVTERCQGCRFTDCVEVCPCECFYRLDEQQMLVINPNTCIDCSLCADVCPVQAIYRDDDVPDVYQSFITLNETRWSEGANVTERMVPVRDVTLEEVKSRELERGHGVVPDPC